MELIERSKFLAALEQKFETASCNEGHCVLITGEAGIGKTSLVNEFCKLRTTSCDIYFGTCDALFTPRPLAPLFDIIWQMGKEVGESITKIADRTEFFSRLFHELENRSKATLIIIEDIHWADEATLDFIKFFARRIRRLHCLLLITYRDNEVNSVHPLRNVLAQLPPDNFTRMPLAALSREAVTKLSEEKGYKGEDVYNISGGNPFYVNEILASYNAGIPDNIKDSILSFYNRLEDEAKQICQLLSVMPTGIETKYFERIDPGNSATQQCLELKILVHHEGLISFKHELYRRTIETSLSPFLRVSLNKKVLELFLKDFEQNNQPERIIHYAKNANENDLVVKYAPIAARLSVSAGAHIEASKLYMSAIEYYQGNDKGLLIQFYESYAYECYLINQIKEAIIYTRKALDIWREMNVHEKIGNSLRFLSRLWWFDGNRTKAESYAEEAINVFSTLPASRPKAMALSNLSQLKMLSDQPGDCIFWGEQAIAMAKELKDEEILCHALNNVGTTESRTVTLCRKGLSLLEQSLEIALRNSYQEHAARAYTNLAHSGVRALRDYAFAESILKPAIKYCEERDLDSWIQLLHSLNALMQFQRGNWEDAYRIAEYIITRQVEVKLGKVDSLAIVARIRMRRGDHEVVPLLKQALSIASDTKELLRLIPAIVASLEYEWITGKSFIENSVIDLVLNMVEKTGNLFENSEFSFWLYKARKEKAVVREFFEGYNFTNRQSALNAVEIWKQIECPYEQALALFEGNDEQKKHALHIMHKLGATTIVEKMKLEMRNLGIKSIPRGARKTSNSANLTTREMDILHLLKDGLQNKEIASRLFISAKTVDNHISSILYKLEVNSRIKAVHEAAQLGILK